MDKYRKQIVEYDIEVQDWLVQIYDEYGSHLNRKIANILKNYDNPDQWPKGHRKRSVDQFIEWEYDYRQKKNLFGIDKLYRSVSGKPFMKRRKQQLEFLMMYYWTHQIIGDEEYWEEYSGVICV